MADDGCWAEATRPSWMELDLGALRHNYRLIREQVGPEVKIIAALKANAYGHGAAAVARALAATDVEMLATGSFADALAIRQAGVRLPVLMFGGTLPEGMAELLAHGLVPTVYDMAGAVAVSAAATDPTAVYVKVDAGLGRLGIALPDALAFIAGIRDLPNIFVEGVYTHLAFYDLMGRDWAHRQLAAFDELLGALTAAGIEVPVTQALASSCLLAGLPSRANAVCPGHLLYGISPVAAEVAPIAPYRSVLRAVKSRLIHVGPLKVGMRGAGHNAPRQVGVLPFGLADGYRPLLPEQPAAVLIRGRRAPIKGVSLEHLTLDLSGFDDAQVGDEAVLLGQSGTESITVDDLARWQGTRPHHVLMALDRKLPQRHLGGA